MRRTCVKPSCWIATCLLALIGAAWTQEAANPAVDEIFADLSKPGSPGCSLGVYRNGKTIYAKGYGLANVEEDVAITPQSVFDIGSISKQFTAMSILLLERQGKLRLDDDIRKYIPKLPDYSRQGGQKITILHLLNHTSGLRDYISLFLLAGINFDSVTTDEDALGFIARQKGLNFSPGSAWQYSNSGYFLLSLIVKRASGKSLRDFASENIFVPLGMIHTQYRNDHTLLIPHRVLAYDRNEKGEYALSVSYGEETGDGMVYTSVEDLQKWDANFYSGQIGGKQLIIEMQQQGKLESGETLKYAKGLFLRNYRGLPTTWHGGGSGGYGSYLLRFPDQHFSVACLCNALLPVKRAHQVAEVYLSEMMKPRQGTFAAPDETKPIASLTPEQLDRWVGSYRDSNNGEIWRVTERDSKLWLDFEGRHLQLRALSATKFEPLDFWLEAHLEFEPARSGASRRLIFNRETELPATLEAVEKIHPSPTELTAYSGAYWSEELGVTYRLVVEDGKLWMKDLIGSDGIVHAGTVPLTELRPIVLDEFDLNGAPLTFRFTRDPKHEVVGFMLNGFRERWIKFKRTSSLK